MNIAGNLQNSGTIAFTNNIAVNALGSIINQSTAAMQAQNLSLITGTGNLTNSGIISALNSINVATQSALTALNINNLSGIINAGTGSINIRDAIKADPD